MGRYVYVREKKTKAGQPGWWPEKKRIEAVIAWMSTGSIPIVSSMTGIPQDTIKTWRKMPWWLEIESQVKEEDNQQLDVKFSKIIQKTLDTIEDRLENGNFQLDPRTGKVRRIPVNLRDTHKVMSDLVDKRKVIRNEPVRIENTEGTNARLVKLASQFAEFVLGKQQQEMKQVGEVYDGDWKEEKDLAIHEKWEAGLQEGASVGTQEETGEGQGSCSTESSPINGC